MAEDIHQLISKIKLEHVFIVGHDIGRHGAYAFVRRYPQITRGAMILAMFEMYRAFPANEKFNQAQRWPNDVPLFVGAGDGSPFARLAPKIAEGLRANGCTHVETGLIPGSVHNVVEDQPETVADLIERYASAHSG